MALDTQISGTGMLKKHGQCSKIEWQIFDVNVCACVPVESIFYPDGVCFLSGQRLRGTMSPFIKNWGVMVPTNLRCINISSLIKRLIK